MAIIRYPSFSASTTNPFLEMLKVRREMDQLFSDLTGGAVLGNGSGVFPALNVREEGERFCVEAEIPGIKPEDIDIAVEGNTLTIRGERKPDGMEDVSYHRRERKAGRFQKAITLPSEINAEAVGAECKDGVLRLVLPKAEQAKPKKITVKSV